MLNFVVETLTAAGMSSDESGEDEKGLKVYRIKKCLWWGKEMTRMMRLVDQDQNKTNAYGNTRSGNPPHRRVPGGSISLREAVPELPKNFYDRRWYKTLLNRDKKELNTRPAVELPDITAE
jgi:hypothetical protein